MTNFRSSTKNRSNAKAAEFSAEEDGLLLSSARIASSKAIRSSIALGITIKVIRCNEIITISPNKSVKEVRKISKPTIDISALRKGMKLDRK